MMTIKSALPNWLATALVALIALASVAIFVVLDPNERFAYWLRGMNDMGSFVLLAAVTTALSLILHHVRPFKISWLGALPIGALIGLFVGPAALVSVLIQFSSAALAGYAILVRIWRLSRRDASPLAEESMILAFLAPILGLAIFGPVLWALSHASVNTAGVHALLYIGSGLIALASLRGTGLSLLKPAGAMLTGVKPDPMVSLLAAPGLISLLSLLSMTGLPELSSDARSAYLGLFEFLRFNGYWSHDPSLSVWALQPLGGLYLAASNYLMGGQEAVRLSNVAMMMLGLGGASLIGGIVSGNRLGAALSFTLAATIPLHLEITAEYYYDNAVAAFVIAAALCLIVLARSQRGQEPTIWIIALALALAGASASKHTSWITTAIFGSLAALLLLVRHDRPVRSIGTLLGVGVGVFAILVLPMVLAAYLRTGNPVFPYYNQIFQSPFYPPEQHGTPHPGYLNWDIFLRATFDTRAFSSSDIRGGFGVAILLLAPALLLGLSTRTARITAALCLAFAGVFVLLSAMQNDLRLLWPISLVLIATSGGLVGMAFNSGGLVRNALMASLLMIAGLQLALLPAGGHGVPETRIAHALSPAGADPLIRKRTPDTLINAMLDSLPDGAVRRLFLSTWKGPSSTTSLEDGWYSHLVRQRLHSARSEDAMIEALRAMAPDAVILGVWEQRMWLDTSLYDILNAHALHILDYSDHQVFLMDNAIAYPVPALPTAQTEQLLERMDLEGGLPSEAPIQFDFLPSGPISEQFRSRFLAQCEARDILHVVIAVWSTDGLHEYTQTNRPCEGPERAFQVSVSARLPDQTTNVTVMVKTQSGNQPFTVSGFESGFKNRFDAATALEL